MADATLLITITRRADETIEALIECPSFVDQSDGFSDATEAIEWVDERVRRGGDPFAPFED